MFVTMSHFRLLVLIAVVLCWDVSITTGRPTRNMPLSAESMGLSNKDFENYKKKAIELKELIAEFNDVTINKKHLTPEFDDMIFPLGIIKVLIERYKLLLNEKKKKRNKRKIMEFKIYRPEYKWVFSKEKPILYTTVGYKAEYVAKVDQAFQYWEEHTCIRFKKVVATRKNPIEEYHLRVQNYGVCNSVVGKDDTYNSVLNTQKVNVGVSGCIPFIPVAIHEIGHALGLFHEQMKPNAKDFVTFKKENVDPGTENNFLPMDGIVSLGVPYDFNSIMHYNQWDFSNTLGPTLVAKDPLYQKNMGQRVELSFLDKKIVNLEYCKDACRKVLKCQRGGYTDPNNCNRCVCPDGFGGRLCQTVGDVHHKTCQKPQIIKVTDTEQCITMKRYKPFTECHWHLKASKGQKIEFYFKNDFAVYCTDQSVCYHWVEIKYKGDYSMPGPRFCCNETLKVNLLSDARLVVVTFKSNYDDSLVSSMNAGFQLCFKQGSCSQREVLTCNTMNKWEIKTEPALPQATWRRAIDGCQGEVKAEKRIRFKIKLVGGNPFKVDKLCLKRPGAKFVVLVMELESSSMASLPMLNNQACFDATSFTHVGPMKQITIDVKSKGTMSISDIKMEVCKQ